jgi:hypothetical protein
MERDSIKMQAVGEAGVGTVEKNTAHPTMIL